MSVPSGGTVAPFLGSSSHASIATSGFFSAGGETGSVGEEEPLGEPEPLGEGDAAEPGEPGMPVASAERVAVDDEEEAG